MYPSIHVFARQMEAIVYISTGLLFLLEHSLYMYMYICHCRQSRQLILMRTISCLILHSVEKIS